MQTDKWTDRQIDRHVRCFVVRVISSVFINNDPFSIYKQNTVSLISVGVVAMGALTHCLWSISSIPCLLLGYQL